MRRKSFPELEAEERRIRNARRHERNPHFCPNCKEPLIQDSGHFVPPSFGDVGFFTCEKTAP